MSAILYGNCERCGLAFQAEEFTQNYVFYVEGRAVTECPQCGEELTLEGVRGAGEKVKGEEVEG